LLSCSMWEKVDSGLNVHSKQPEKPLYVPLGASVPFVDNPPSGLQVRGPRPPPVSVSAFLHAGPDPDAFLHPSIFRP
jgi:hypothetical protein